MFYINVPLGRHGGDYGTKNIQVLHYGIWPWRRILNGACISISNLRENIAWQTHRPQARGPLKSGAWGGRPTCHPQTPLLGMRYSQWCCWRFKSSGRWLCVTQWVFSDVIKDSSAFIFTVNQSSDGPARQWRWRWNIATTQPKPQCHIPEDLNEVY